MPLNKDKKILIYIKADYDAEGLRDMANSFIKKALNPGILHLVFVINSDDRNCIDVAHAFYAKYPVTLFANTESNPLINSIVRKNIDQVDVFENYSFSRARHSYKVKTLCVNCWDEKLIAELKSDENSFLVGYAENFENIVFRLAEKTVLV